MTMSVSRVDGPGIDSSANGSIHSLSSNDVPAHGINFDTIARQLINDVAQFLSDECCLYKWQQ